MTIDRQKGKLIFICDGDHCLESFDTGTRDFIAALDGMQRGGWKNLKESGYWKHYCPTCVREIEGEG